MTTPGRRQRYAHCAQRTDDEFWHAVGVPEVDLSRLLAKPST